jgi:tRNA(Ile)-lysidine synthase
VEPSILEESFKERLEGLGILPDDTLALGVSGGADSMALLHLGKSYSSNIVAMTVDHALRTESRGEAEQVAQWCEALGIEHHILTWQGEKPATRIQREARRAR